MEEAGQESYLSRLKRTYEPGSKTPVMLLFVRKNYIRQDQMIEDGIMDKNMNVFRRNGMNSEEVAFSIRQIKIFIVFSRSPGFITCQSMITAGTITQSTI